MSLDAEVDKMLLNSRVAIPDFYEFWHMNALAENMGRTFQAELMKYLMDQ